MKCYKGWKLLDEMKKKFEGKEFFYRRYVHPESKSGIIFFSTLREGKIRYVVEGYGIGTISKTFKEISLIAPIQRYEFDDEKEAEKRLYSLQKENTRLWEKYRLNKTEVEK